jgi:hypothetical protein
MDSGLPAAQAVSGTTEGATEVAEAQPRTRGMQEKVMGWVAVVLIAFAVYLLIAGGPRDGEVAAAVGAAPPVTILAPESGTEVGRRIDLRFSSEQALSVQPGGWGVGGLHLHADVGGTEVMPGAADIRRLQDGSYQWTIEARDTGSIAVRLFWSDAGHVPVPLSATEDVFLTVR